MSVGATRVVCVLRPVRTPRAPISAHVRLDSALPVMARVVKVCLLMFPTVYKQPGNTVVYAPALTVASLCVVTMC